MRVKLTCVFLLIAFLQISFASNAQYITLSKNNISLTELFNEIKKQSGYDFVYKYDVLNKGKTVDIHVRNKPLREVLDASFENQPFSYSIESNTVIIFPKDEKKVTGNIQQKEIKGKVTDAAGEPLPGATVQVVGKNIATSTNIEGDFTIKASINDVIEIRMLGYQPYRVSVQSSTNMVTAKLQLDNNKLDEVVVIGYGETTRKNLTTAQTSISAKEIGLTVNTTFDQALQGRAPGVMVTTNSAQPGGGISVNIRGISTLSGSTDPLYVIDGVQLQPELTGYNNSSSLNPLAQLNPSDIENIEILQGPSAAAIYGSRATNGVVLVTTKRGKSGDAKINYEYSHTIQDIPAQIPVLDLKDWVIMNNELRRFKNNAIPVNQRDSSILGAGTNWQQAIFRRAPLVKHQISFSGGNEKTTYYLSGEHFNQEGAVRGSSFNRNGIRLNLDNHATKWLKLGVNVSANQTNDDVNTTVNSSIMYAFSLPPYIPVYNADGTYGGFTNAEGTGGDRASQLNPFAKSDLMTNTQKRNNLNGGINATVFLLKGLQFRTSLNSSYNNTTTVDFTPQYHIGYSYVDKAILKERGSNNYYYNWNQLLEYRKEINNAHDITFMVSHESQGSRKDGLTGERRGFPVNELPGGEIPGINLGDDVGQLASGWKGWWAQESYFGRLSYAYKGRYLATFSYRGDGSVNFGENNRWGYFPAGSVAWRVSEEPFFEKLTETVSDLKLRFETGYTGNQGDIAGVYAGLRGVPALWGNGFLIDRYKNPDLKWESTLTRNFGFNLGLLDDRISLEGDIYSRKTDNLLMPNQLPLYMGTQGHGSINPPIVNLGMLQNNGWAFSVRTVNIKSKNLRWTSNFNISHNKTKVNKFYQETAVFDMTNWRAGGGFVQRSAVGQEVWQFWGYRSDGIFKTMDEVLSSPVPRNGTSNNRIPTGYNGVFIGDYKYRDLNHDELIDPTDMTYIGNPYPDFTFGFTNEISYKGLSMSAVVIGSQGNEVYNAFRYNFLNPYRVYNYYNVRQESFDGYARIAYDEFNQPYLLNPDATVARIEGQNGNYERASDQFVEDASYIKIKNITLNYQIPMSLVDKTKIIKGMRIGFGIQNVFTFTKYSGYDPEIGVDVGNQSDVQRRTFGVDVGQYPQTRSYNFNLSITL